MDAMRAAFDLRFVQLPSLLAWSFITTLKELAATMANGWRERIRARDEAKARAATGDRPARTICIRASVVVPLPPRMRSSTRIAVRRRARPRARVARR
jgi:hypothetical protein